MTTVAQLLQWIRDAGIDPAAPVVIQAYGKAAKHGDWSIHLVGGEVVICADLAPRASARQPAGVTTTHTVHPDLLHFDLRRPFREWPESVRTLIAERQRELGRCPVCGGTEFEAVLVPDDDTFAGCVNCARRCRA